LLAGSLRLFWPIAVLWLELGTHLAERHACACPDACLVRLPAIRSCSERAPVLTAISQYVTDMQLRARATSGHLMRPDSRFAHCMRHQPDVIVVPVLRADSLA
jgi:hypothetical protein